MLNSQDCFRNSMFNSKPFSKKNTHNRTLFFLIGAVILSVSHSLKFKELQVSASTLTIDTVSTYTFVYDRSEQNYGIINDVVANPVPQNSLVTLSVPSVYTINNSLSISSKINNGATIVASYSISGNIITISNLFPSQMIVYNLTLLVANLMNPSPAIVTVAFNGTIGDDFSQAIDFTSIVALEPADFTKCSLTFSTRYVNRTQSMIFTITAKTLIPSQGTLQIIFPSNRWSQSSFLLTSPSPTLPITTSMVCGNLSANVKSTLVCKGFPSQNMLVVTNIFAAMISAGQTFSFEVRNFLSPPTNKPADRIQIYSTDANSNKINYCQDYVSDLIPNEMVSSKITITNAANTGSLTVNLNYTLRFFFQTVDAIALIDYFEIEFPTGSLFSFGLSTLTTAIPILRTTVSYSSNILRIELNQAYTPKNPLQPAPMFIAVGQYTAPPSIQPTSNFKISVFRNSFPIQVGQQSITAVASTTLVGSLSGRTNQVVSRNTTYTFSITLNDALSSSGKIRIKFPSEVQILATSTCATITGGPNLVVTPTCAINSAAKTVQLVSLNQSNALIGIQTFSVAISGIRNPQSIAITSTGFQIRSFYRSTDASLVSVGTFSGFTSKQASIDPSNVVIQPSSFKVLEKTVTYTVKLTIQNDIPIGGTIRLFVPKPVMLNTASLPSSCKRGINTATTSTTSCVLISEDASGYLINFNNPLASAGITVGQYIMLQLSGIATNPPSTTLVSTFKIYTYATGSDAALISKIESSLSVKMSIAAALTLIYSRDSSKNYDLTSYQFTIKQDSAMEISSVVVIEFPPEILPNVSSLCGITTPIVNSNLACSLINSTTIKVTLPNTAIISSNTNFVISISNVRNPTSYRLPGDFNVATYASDYIEKYALGKTSNKLKNNVPSQFFTVTGQYSPKQLGSEMTLIVSFQPAFQTPSYLQVSIPSSQFTITSGLACSQKPNFIGQCEIISPYTIKITGNFISTGLTSFQIQGFKSNIDPPSSVEHIKLSSFALGGFELDYSSDKVSFAIQCNFPCKTCDPVNKSACLSCYNNTAITDKIIHDIATQSCYSNCPDGQFENLVTKLCDSCDPNCLTCQAQSNFCTSCKATSSFKYLNKVSLTSQICVNQCEQKMYPDLTKTPPTCVNCVSPCQTCTSLNFCLTCQSTYYFWSNSCSKSCPVGTTVPDDVTGKCQLCSANCLTCQGLVNNCVSCNIPLILYNNKCITQCLAPLVYRPQILTCGNCDVQCNTCSKVGNNCTSCSPTSTFKYFHLNNCLVECPDLFYETTSTCTLCSSLNINCDYCITSTSCDKCNIGFVFFNGQCPATTPQGYVDISGLAQPCTGDCATCATTQSNCTSCKLLNLNINVCQLNCPAGTIPINKVCKTCSYPCRTCSDNVNNCTSCLANETPQLYLITNRCDIECPNFFYPDNNTNRCLGCQSPCMTCLDQSICVTCENNYFLYLGKSCLSACPSKFIGINKICEMCTSPCKTCIDSTTKCLTCETTYFYLNSTNRCLLDCGEGLYQEFLNQTCISCTPPCLTCVNTTSTCLSCLTGILFNNQCIGQCPQKMYNETSVCKDCPIQCSNCVSKVKCTRCTSSYLLFNDFCITKCPQTHAVITDGACTKCSSTNCHKCLDNDLCYICVSDYNLLNGACLSVCPTGFETNGTHCLEVLAETLESSNSNMFPVPFTIVTSVVLIACLMSKLQNDKTFLPGAVFALIGVAETLALLYFIYLYYITLYLDYPIGLFIALGALGVLYLLNVLSIVQSIVLCYDKKFCIWRDSSCINKFCNALSTILSIFISHKFKHLMFCRLFSFGVFSAQLDEVKKFKIFNIFSFISLIHSGGAIFSVITIIKLADPKTQMFHACIDVLIVTGLNIVMAFFNAMKADSFFDQLTPEGLLLNKKVLGDEDSFNGKISIDGNDMQNQEGHGYYSKIQHTLASNQAFKFKQSDQSRQDLQSDYDSLTNIVQKQYEQVSVQAYDILDDKQPSRNKIDFSTLKVDDANNNSKFTTIFQNQDKSIQNTIDYDKNKRVDFSIQKYNDISYEDRSIQRTFQQNKNNDVSVQYSNNLKQKPKDVSIQGSLDYVDRSGQYSFLQSEKGVQNMVLLNDKSIQQNAQQKSWAGQNTIDMKDISIQKTQQRVEYEQIDDSLQQNDQTTLKNTDNIFFIDEQEQGLQSSPPKAKMQTIARQQLPEQKQEQFDLPSQQIKSYQEQLEQKIIQKQKQLQRVRKQIELKQRQSILKDKIMKEELERSKSQLKTEKDDKFTMMRMNQPIQEGTSMDDEELFLAGQSVARNKTNDQNFVVDMNKYIQEKSNEEQSSDQQMPKSSKTKAKPQKRSVPQQKVQQYQKNRQIQVQASKHTFIPLNIERQQPFIESPPKQPGKIRLIDDSNKRASEQNLIESQEQVSPFDKTQNYIYEVQNESLNQDEDEIIDFRNNQSHAQTNKSFNKEQKDQGFLISKKTLNVKSKDSQQVNQKESPSIKQQLKDNKQPIKKQEQKKANLVLDQSSADRDFNQVYEQINDINGMGDSNIEEEFDSSQDIPIGLLNNYDKKNTQSEAEDHNIRRNKHKRVLSKEEQLKQENIEGKNLVDHQKIRRSFNQELKRQQSSLSQKKKLIPSQNKQALHINLNKLNNYHIDKTSNQSSNNSIPRQQKKTSSLLANAAKNIVMGGKNDLENQKLTKKMSSQKNPLVTSKKWQFEHEELNKNSLQQESNGDNSYIQGNRRQNNLLPPTSGNKKQQIPIVPFETDKQETQFLHAAMKAGASNQSVMTHQKSLKSFHQDVGSRKKTSVHKMSARQLISGNKYGEQIEVHFDKDLSRQKSAKMRQVRKVEGSIERPKIRPQTNSASKRIEHNSKQRPPMGYGTKPPTKPAIKQFQSEQIFGDSYQQNQFDQGDYSQSDSPQKRLNKQDRNNILIGKMIQRPQNDDLYEYYNRASTQKGKSRRNRGSKQAGKNKKQISLSKQKQQNDKKLEKIYMQRLDSSSFTQNNAQSRNNSRGRYN